MKNFLSVFIAISVLIGSVGALPILAADKIVLYENDFETLQAGDKPTGMYLLENEANQYLARVAKVDNGKALFIHHVEGCLCGKSGGPFARIAADFMQYKDMTLSFKTKGAGGASIVTLNNADNGESIMLFNQKIEAWTTVEIFMDLEKAIYIVSANGQKKADGKLDAFGMPMAAQIRFMGLQVYYDDIKLESTGVRETPYTPPVNVLPDDVYVPTTMPSATTVPTGMYPVLNTDFSDATLASASATKLNMDGEIRNPFSTTTNYVEVVEAGKNRLLRFGSLDGKLHGPQVRLGLPQSAKRYVVDFAVAFGEDSSLMLKLYQHKTEILGKIVIVKQQAGSTNGEWQAVHLEIDLEKCTVSGSVNGVAFEESGFVLDGIDNIELSFNGTTTNNALFYIDNICFYSKDKPHVDTIFVDKKIYWENVKPAKALSAESFVNNLVSHPRVFVTNWEEIRAKVNQDYFTKQWYAGIKMAADSALETPMTAWKLNSRNNVLESARAAKVRLVSLAFVYGITGEKKYADRAYEEALFYGTWQDWSGMNSTFVTAQIMEGYGCMYDWLYDYLTKEQRQTLIDIMKKHGFPDFLYHYVNKDGFAGAGSGNWNPVCNEAAIACALAIADEEPLLAEYILETAPPTLWNAMVEYSPEGAYEETVSYWNAGTMNIAFIAWFLDHAFEPSFSVPQDYDVSGMAGMSFAAEYPIYGHGPAGMFNYGDCVPGYQSSPALYWAAATYDKPQYAWWANNVQVHHGAGMDGQYLVAALCFYNPEQAYYVPGAFALDKFYTAEGYHNAAWLRSSWNDETAVYAAMQGGPIGAHQHLSLGTYVIDYMGKRFIRQLNYYGYALDFGNLTLAYYRRGEGYNTLIANPTRGEDIRRDAEANLIAHGTSAGTAFGVFDMTSTNADFTDAKRGIMLTDNRRRVIVQDEVTAKIPSEFYWFANTDASVKIAPDGKSALLTIDGQNMLARILKAPAEAKFELVERKSLFEGVNNVITGDEGTKLQLHFKDKTALELSVEYVALNAGEGIPTPWPYTKMENWSANDNTESAIAAVGSNVVLKLGSPNALANGIKTMVDTVNADVVPFTENGRTLVPVRFISEAFGAKVSWNEETQTVGVKYLDKDIRLAIGSNEMYVNGEIVILDVPANTYNSRTLIPLRALVEALGMKVFWDDRGLISIGIADATYTEEQIVKIIEELALRVIVNGQDALMFNTLQTDYVLDIKPSEAIPQISVCAGGNSVAVTQANALGESARFSVGDKVYTVLMQTDTFANIVGSKDPGVIQELEVSVAGAGGPGYDTFIYVEDLQDSTNWEKYPKRGIVDGVINTEIKNRWASDGEGEWISVDFGVIKNVHSMAFAGVSQNTRAYKFDVLVSEDGINWTTIHTGGAPKTTDKMSIIPLGDAQARFVKLIGYGSNESTWNTYAEIRFYESASQQAEDITYWPVYFAERDLSGGVGEQARLMLSGVDALRNIVEVRADAMVSYDVADPSIATVSAEGVLTFHKTGKTTLTITVMQNGYWVKATVPITVK